MLAFLPAYVRRHPPNHCERLNVSRILELLAETRFVLVFHVKQCSVGSGHGILMSNHLVTNQNEVLRCRSIEVATRRERTAHRGRWARYRIVAVSTAIGTLCDPLTNWPGKPTVTTTSRLGSAAGNAGTSGPGINSQSPTAAGQNALFVFHVKRA